MHGRLGNDGHSRDSSRTSDLWFRRYSRRLQVDLLVSCHGQPNVLLPEVARLG